MKTVRLIKSIRRIKLVLYIKLGTTTQVYQLVNSDRNNNINYKRNKNKRCFIITLLRIF